MRPHGQSRRRWTGGIAVGAAFALLAGVIAWAFAARDERDLASTPAVAATTASTPAPTPTPIPTSLPEPRPSAPAPLPAAEAAADPLPFAFAGRGTHKPKARPLTEPAAFATLDLTLVQPCGAPAAGVTLKLSAPESRWWLRVTDQLISDDAGRVALPQLPADTPLHLSGADHLDYAVLDDLELTLAPDEHRVLVQTVSRDMRSITVQVHDRQGHPIAGVDTHLVPALTLKSTRTLQESRATTDGDGVAHFAATAAESASITASLDGFAPAWVSELPLDRDPMLVELTLDTGFPVEVEIADAAGRPRDVDRVELRGTPVVVKARRLAMGRYGFDAFPESATGITAFVQGRFWTIEHTARQPVARIVVPSPGALSMRWDSTRLHCDAERLLVSSDPPGWGRSMPVDEATRVSGGPVRVDDLTPGDYLIQLECANGGPAARPTRASVVSDVTTAVVLEP